MVIVLVFTISANAEPETLDEEDELLELPRLPALVLPVLPEPLVEAPEPELAELVLPADTESPGERLARDTIVPPVGADREVSESAASAVCTLNCALSTAACAVAMLPAEDVVFVEPPDEEDPEPPAAEVAVEGAPVVGADLGVVVVDVVVLEGAVCGVVVAGVVVAGFFFRGVVVDGVVVVDVVLVGLGFVRVLALRVSETNSAAAEFFATFAVVALEAEAPVVVVEELDDALLSTEVSWSSAATRLRSA